MSDSNNSRPKAEAPPERFRGDETDNPVIPPQDTPAPEPEPEDTVAPEPAAEDTPAPEPITEDTSAPEPVTEDTPAPEPATEDTPAPEPATEDTAAPEAAAEDTPAPEPSPEETQAPEPSPEETQAPEPATEDTPAPEPAPEETSAPEPAPEETSAPEPTPEETSAPEPAVEDTPAPEPSIEDTPSPEPPAAEEPSAAPTEEETVGPEQTEDVTAAPEDQEPVTETATESPTEAPVDLRTEDNPTGTITKEPTTEPPTLSPEEEAYNLDEILKPRPLIPDANPVLRLAPEECNSQSILPETVDTDDSPFDPDDRTDIVWKKSIQNDTALNDFIQCNLAGPDLVIAAFSTGSPYLHVLVTRPLTVKQMTYLDELVSFYQDPVNYWVYYKKQDYALDSAVANHDEELLLTTFLQPISDRDDSTIISLAFVLQFWSEDDEPFEVVSRMYNWSHGASIGEKTFTLNGSGTAHDPYYQKVMVNGLGGVFNTKHEHICQIYGRTSRAGTFAKIVGMQMLWGSRQQIGELLG